MVAYLNSGDGGTDGVAVTAGNSGGASGTAFDSATAAPAYTAAVALSGLGFDTSVTAAATRDVRWSTTIGSLNTFFVRDYFRVTGFPPVVARLWQTLSAGTARFGSAMDTTGHIGIRNLSTGTFATSGLSTSIAAINTWHRQEIACSWSGTAWTCTLNLYLGANVGGTVPDESLTTTGGLITGMGTVDTYAWGALASAATTWGVFHDSIGLSDTAFLGPDGPPLPPRFARRRPQLDRRRPTRVSCPPPQPQPIAPSERGRPRPVARRSKPQVSAALLTQTAPPLFERRPRPLLAAPRRRDPAALVLTAIAAPTLVLPLPASRVRRKPAPVRRGRMSAPPPLATVAVAAVPGSLTVTTRGPALTATTSQPALSPTVRSASLSLTIAGGDP